MERKERIGRTKEGDEGKKSGGRRKGEVRERWRKTRRTKRGTGGR